ncbi:MAG: FkbM family methyltransferase [Cyanobacteriota bacterium]|nr:FkbM family methyltransferase [Cyanobacteriota bacterium]
MIRKFLNAYAFVFARRRFAKLNRLIFLIGARGLGILNCHSPFQSGEEPFLRQFLANYDSPEFVVMDVGANQGQFASWVLSATNKLKVVSFEPNPAAAQRLSVALSALADRHRLIPRGAASAPGEAIIFDYGTAEGSGHATLYSDVLTTIRRSDCVASIPIQLSTIDGEVEAIQETVCLLKIDTEGHEKDVLLGALKLLRDSPPPAILIEFNEMNAVSGTHYFALQKLLGDAYASFRLLPGGQLLPLDRQLPFYTEIYAYQNLVFLRRDLRY